MVRLHRHREEQGHQGLRPRRQDQEHRPRRSPDGHPARRHHIRHRRRHTKRQEVQGGPDGRAFGRLHTVAVPEHASRLRDPQGTRHHNGLRRTYSDGRRHLHGRPCQVLPGLHPGRILRQVLALQDRHEAYVRDRRQDNQGQGQGRRHRTPNGAGKHHKVDRPVRPGADGAQPRRVHDTPLQERIHVPHRAEEVRGFGLCHALRSAVQEQLPRGRGRPALHSAHQAEEVRRGGRPHQEDEPVPRGLRQGLRPSLRGALQKARY
ncbi:MAG: hypothetical protein BWY00_01677 [Firmicutes bacterium ADurb.Bin153]|nr:MAG: hypothetical protein BWY00_01677 [Firmicutes bacterium ADurb.Bin153]